MPKEIPKTGMLNQVWRREDNTSAIYTELQTIDIIWFNDHTAWEVSHLKQELCHLNIPTGSSHVERGPPIMILMVQIDSKLQQYLGPRDIVVKTALYGEVCFSEVCVYRCVYIGMHYNRFKFL